MIIGVINGSAKAGNGTTAQICELVSRSFAASAYLPRYPVQDKVGYCLDCKKCFISPFKCVLKDDMDSYLDLIQQSDLLILATPLYTNFMSASLKAVLDRLRPMQTGKYQLNQHGCYAPVLRSEKIYHWLLVASCGFPEAINFKSLTNWFDAFIHQQEKFKSAGQILVSTALKTLNDPIGQEKLAAEIQRQVNQYRITQIPIKIGSETLCL